MCASHADSGHGFNTLSGIMECPSLRIYVYLSVYLSTCTVVCGNFCNFCICIDFQFGGPARCNVFIIFYYGLQMNLTPHLRYFQPSKHSYIRQFVTPVDYLKLWVRLSVILLIPRVWNSTSLSVRLHNSFLVNT